MNLHDQDTFLRGKNEGIEVGIQQGLQQGLQQGISQGLQQGISQGSQQAKIETARNFLSMGLSVEQVSQGTGLSKEAIIELANINLK